METLATLFLWCLMVFIGLLPAFYEYEKALCNSYGEVLKGYVIEELLLNTDPELPFLEWCDRTEVLDTSYRLFTRSRNYGGNFFFFI